MHIEIKNSWNNFLNYFSTEQKDIYFSDDYVQLACGKNQEPLCIVCEESEKIMLMPFLRGEYKCYCDFETPYGYGGPISNCNDKEWNQKALNEIISFFSKEKYLAGFIRFHPLLKNADICKNIFTVIDDRKTIAINTSVSEEEIWETQIHSKNRNMIRKAEKNGLEFIRDNDFKYIEEFKKIYNSTMQRLDADDFYFFDDDYYQKFVNVFKGNGFLGCVKKNEEIIGAALFMYDTEHGHYHLAGSDRAFSSLGTNNLLLWKVACEMHKEGVKEFHLGGGTNSDEENSLFKFKRAFSPNEKQFSIGKIIFNINAYNSICSEWAENNPEKAKIYKNHLLKYRY